MLKAICLTLCLLCLAVTAQAGPATKQLVPFSKYSAASGSAVYTSVINVMPFRKKTVVVNGYDMSTKAEASLSGTALVQCGPTTAGPWTTCVNNNYAQTAVSTTANAALTWEDVSSYVRVSWAKTAGRVSVWLNLSE